MMDLDKSGCVFHPRVVGYDRRAGRPTYETRCATHGFRVCGSLQDAAFNRAWKAHALWHARKHYAEQASLALDMVHAL